MKRLTHYYEWILLLPAVLPLFYVQGMMYPLLAPKTFALRALGIVSLALFAYLVSRGHPFFYDRLRRWQTWIPAALLALAYVASAFGVDFYHSFWSTFERGDGLLTLTVCVGYFYLFLLSANESWLPRLVKLVAWVGSLAAVYLVVQWIAVSTHTSLPFIVKANGRVGGTMGNAAFLAAYLGMAFFATLAAAPLYRARARKVLYGGAGLQLLAILLTATRGTELALLAVGTAVVGYLAVTKAGKVRRYARTAFVALGVLAALFIAFRAELADAPFEPVRRLAEISLSDPTTASRLFVWNAVSREALTRPLLGYGAEHIDVPFDTIYDPSMMVEEWFDRSHNIYLDYFVQYGFGGLALYLALIAVLGYSGVILFRRGSRYGPPLLCLVGVYAVQNFFVFDTAMTLWLLLVLVATVLVHVETHGAEKPFVLLHPRPLAGVAMGAALLYCLVPVVLQPLRANLLAFEAYQYQIVDVERASRALERGMALNTYADLEFGYNEYFIYTEQQSRLTGGELVTAYESAVTALSRNFERYTYDARTAVYLAQILSQAPPGAATDTTLLAGALERAMRLSPKRSQPWYILANLSISDANTYPPQSAARAKGYAAAQDLLTQYLKTVPRLSMAHYVLAQLLYASGNHAGAAEEAAKGREYYTEDLATAMRAVRYYEQVLDIPNATFFLKEILRIDPTNENAQADLDTINAHATSPS